MLVAVMTPVKCSAAGAQQLAVVSSWLPEGQRSNNQTQVHKIAQRRATGRCTSVCCTRKAVIDPDTFVPSTDVFAVTIRSRLRNNK